MHTDIVFFGLETRFLLDDRSKTTQLKARDLDHGPSIIPRPLPIIFMVKSRETS